jgi:hypothetical protein
MNIQKACFDMCSGMHRYLGDAYKIVGDRREEMIKPH